MKTLRTLTSTTALALLASPALAVDTTRVYSSGILIFAFLGFLALLLLVQLIPTIIMLVGMIKGLASSAQGNQITATADGKKN